jgi:hypothetical protein
MKVCFLTILIWIDEHWKHELSADGYNNKCIVHGQNKAWKKNANELFVEIIIASTLSQALSVNDYGKGN